MVSQPILCRYCESSDVVRYGTQSGSARFKCKQCGRIFKTEYIYRACEPDIKEQVVEMSINGSGVRDTAACSELLKILSFRL
jgi:transposase